jgi:hypothetical protein
MFSYLIVSGEIKFPYILESSITCTPFPLVLALRIICPWPPVAATYLVGARASKTSRLVILFSYRR